MAVTINEIDNGFDNALLKLIVEGYVASSTLERALWQSVDDRRVARSRR